MKKQVFIINGSGGVGKDTFINLVKEILNLSVINFSSVDKVKEIATIIGWTGDKTEKDRKFLSDLKLLCTDYNDMPFSSMNEDVEEFAKSDAAMLFLHIREPKEIEKAKVKFNAKTILIKRDTVKQIVSNMADGGVFNYEYDVVIDNNSGLENLCKKAVQFVNDFNSDNIKQNY
jgi:lysyl-tRNA synthetase class I